MEVDKFYSYKKSTCKECLIKKVICDYCNNEFNSTNSSKHKKQRYSTHDGTMTNDSTSKNSTSNSSRKNDIIVMVLGKIIVLITTYQIINNFVISLTHGKTY